METVSKIVHHVDWTKSHCGVMLMSIEDTIAEMPEVAPILNELVESGTLELPPEDYVVDVKVHMLMPRQFPCIPNWHCDFLPRDAEGNRVGEKIDRFYKMYEWISGAPYTEFQIPGTEATYFVEPQHWHSFDQRDIHRGTMSHDHQWRCFIRVIPEFFVHESTINRNTVRRHCQVYLDSTNFRW